MKRLIMSVAVISLLLLGSMNSFAKNEETFADYFKGIDHPKWDIDFSTEKALLDGQDLASILTQAGELNIDLDVYWSEFVAGAQAAGMSGLDIWSVLIEFVSEDTDISSVSQSSP